ncbi:MAG: hypothetical protein ACR2KZ_21210 [Segetibacter sp.]
MACFYKFLGHRPSIFVNLRCDAPFICLSAIIFFSKEKEWKKFCHISTFALHPIVVISALNKLARSFKVCIPG